MREKSESIDKFKEFYTMVKNVFQSSISYFQSDGGGEYVNNNFSSFLKQNGIVHRLSCPHTSVQNGRAERIHRHISNVLRCLIFQASMSFKFWVDACLYVVSLINVIPLPVLRFQSPFEQLYGRVIDYNLICIFGCLCYPFVAVGSCSKFLPRLKPCLFLGSSDKHKGFKCLDPSSNRVLISRYVHFVEEYFSFQTFFHTEIPTSPKSVPSKTVIDNTSKSSYFPIHITRSYRSFTTY